MYYIIFGLVLLNCYFVLHNYVVKNLSTIFRHDLFNDLQLVDGYIVLNKPEKSKQYLKSAYDKKDAYSILDKASLPVKLGYLLLYRKIHSKTSNFDVYLNENILENMFFSLSFVKTIFKVFKHLKTLKYSSITIEIEKDCIEVITPDEIKSYSI